jgi:hypothetical protein
LFALVVADVRIYSAKRDDMKHAMFPPGGAPEAIGCSVLFAVLATKAA